MKTLLNVQHLFKSYGKEQALSDISFQVHEGEIVSILGPSGCGKSTLLQMIAGLLQPTSGRIEIDGVNVADEHMLVPPEKRPVNMVFQNYALWPHMNVFSNITYGLSGRNYSPEQRRRKVAELLDMMQLQGLEYRLPAHLSGGQQQRVGIARALATEPKLLLMDEPLSNLDIKLRVQMRTELGILLRKLNMTVIHVTHDPQEALALADRLLIMRKGGIEQYGTTDDVFRSPATTWVAHLLGYTNRIEGAVFSPPTPNESGFEEDEQWIKAEVDGQTVVGRLGAGRPGERQALLQGSKYTINFHPEDITVHDDDGLANGGWKNGKDHGADTGAGFGAEHGSEKINCMKGTVKHASFEGLAWRVFLSTASNQEVSLLTAAPPANGTELQVRFPQGRTFIYGREHF